MLPERVPFRDTDHVLVINMMFGHPVKERLGRQPNGLGHTCGNKLLPVTIGCCSSGPCPRANVRQFNFQNRSSYRVEPKMSADHFIIFTTLHAMLAQAPEAVCKTSVL